MSSTVGTSGNVANYPSSDAPGAATTESPASAAAQAAVNVAWGKEAAKDAKDEMQRGIVPQMGQSFAAEDDDDVAKAAKNGVKQGAQKAGVLVTDKGLHTMSQATKDHPATNKLVSKLADPNDADTKKLQGDLEAGRTPDLTFMHQAYMQVPAESLPANAPGGSNPTTAPQQDPQATASTGQSGGVAKAWPVSAGGGAHAISGPSASTQQPAPGSTPANGGGAAGSPASVQLNATTATPAGVNGPTPQSVRAALNGASNAPHLQGGNWNTYVAMAMYNSTKELQAEKKSELGQIKKFNAMLDAVNTYVSNILMPAQQDLQTRVANAKNKDDADRMEVTIYGAMRNIDSLNCGQDANGAAVLLQKPGTDPAPDAQKVTQVTLSSMISEADQLRQSISNNQQLHSSNYQALDTQVTSNLNMITALFKNVNETQSGIVRNLPT